MLHALLRLGISSGLVAASATAGALIAFSARQGSGARPFNAAAQLLLGGRALAAEGMGWVAAVGVLVHLGWGVLLGLLVALVAAPLRPAWRPAAAIALAGALLVLHPRLAPFALSDGFPPLLTPGQRVLLYAVLAAALVLGMRLAETRGYADGQEDWRDSP